MAGFLQQRCRGIKIRERILEGHHKATQQFQCARCVAGGNSNLGETQKIGSRQLVLVQVARKHKFENFSRRLFVACFKKFPGRRAQDFRRWRGLRVRAVAGNALFESANLRRNLQFQGNKLRGLLLPRFWSKGREEFSRRRVLFRLHQIVCPVELPTV